MIRYRVITGPQKRGTGGTLIWVEKFTETVATRRTLEELYFLV